MKTRVSGVLILFFAGLCATASAEMHAFSGFVTYAPNGVPIADEPVAIRYVYTFDGVEPHEGRAVVLTNASGRFELVTDITNIWGMGEIEAVVAWGTARGVDHYLSDAQPSIDNRFETWSFHPGKPGPGGDPDDPSVGKSKQQAPGQACGWSNIKALYH